MSWISYGEKRTPVGPGARDCSKDPKLYIQVLELYQKLKHHQQERPQLPGGLGFHESPARHREDSPGLTSFPVSQSTYLSSVTLLRELRALHSHCKVTLHTKQ